MFEKFFNSPVPEAMRMVKMHGKVYNEGDSICVRRNPKEGQEEGVLESDWHIESIAGENIIVKNTEGKSKTVLAHELEGMQPHTMESVHIDNTEYHVGETVGISLNPGIVDEVRITSMTTEEVWFTDIATGQEKPKMKLREFVEMVRDAQSK